MNETLFPFPQCRVKQLLKFVWNNTLSRLAWVFFGIIFMFCYTHQVC